MNRNASTFIIVGVVFFIITVGMITLPRVADPSTIDSFIGEHQYLAFITSKDAEATQLFITLAISYAADDAVSTLIEHSGFFLERSDTGERVGSPCGEYMYPLYRPDCLPRFLASYESYLREDFNEYLQAYDRQRLGRVYSYSLETGQRTVSVSGEAERPLRLTTGPTIQEHAITQSTPYMRGILGGFGDEVIIQCGTGRCLADVAEYYYEHFQSLGGFDYVYGGESPYSYEDTKDLLKTNQTFFPEEAITRTQPHSGQLTVPGFDASGWVWWVGKHAGVEWLLRYDVQGFWQTLSSPDFLGSKGLICEGSECTRLFLQEHVSPGDMFFYGEGDKASHMGIFVDDLTIVHARPSTGLIREELPLSYAEGEMTRIIGVYRHQWPGGYETLEEFADSQNLQIHEELIGPAVLCVGDEQPTKRMIDGIESDSLSGAPMKDMVVKAALEQKVDPALLAAHAWQESQFINSCAYNDKSMITGCAWYPGCSGDCSCDKASTTNDLTQLQCTADADIKGYTEAITGIDIPSHPGAYPKCVEHADDPEAMWTCILCIYQGNYDELVDGWDKISRGPQDDTYFTRDGTCLYAELVSDHYCKYRNYFQDQGYSTAIAGQSGQVTRSHLSFTPYLQAEATISFPELDSINEFVKNVNTTCRDDLASCLDNEITTYNENNRPSLTRNGEHHAFSLDLAEQIEDCKTNGQDDCSCEIQLDFSLRMAGQEEYKVRLGDDGTIMAGAWKNTNQLKYLTTIHDTGIDLTNAQSTRIKKNDEDHDYVELLIDTNDLQEGSYFEAEDDGDDYTWPLSQNLYLKKNDSYTWLLDEKPDATEMCRQNKQSFRLQAELPFNEEPLNFAITLEDEGAPEISAFDITRKRYVETHALVVSWSILDSTDQPFRYKLDFGGPAGYLFYEPDFKEFNLDEFTLTPKEFTLYRTEHDGAVHYNVIIPRLADGELFVNETMYNITLIADDHYLNTEQNTTSYTFDTSRDPPERDGVINEFLLTIEGSSLSQGFHYTYTQGNTENAIPHGNRESDGSGIDPISAQNQAIIQNLAGDLYTPEPYLDENGTQLLGEQYGEPLYDLRDIPNVVCDESNTQHGKVCAARESLVRRLYQISQDYLIPNNQIMYVTQGYRTYDIQKSLWDAYLAGTGNQACNPREPGEYWCPHMQSGAIDMNLFYANWTLVEPRTLWEELMCDYGFVRYSGESWHFEYGTWRWQQAEEQRAQGVEVCRY